MTYNRKLKQARLEKNWTLEHASAAVGVHISTYNKWELGIRRPHLTTLALLCEAFGASAETLGFGDAYLEQAHGEASLSVAPLVLAEYVTQEDEPMLYDMLEVRVLSQGLTWKFQRSHCSFLQALIQQEIRRFDSMMHFQQNDEMQISRRQALRTIAKLPIGMFGLNALGTLHLNTAEELLPLCAAGLTACTELINQGEILNVQHILATYLPTLVTLAQHPSAHQKNAAHLTIQGYLLASAIAEHLGMLGSMEEYCKQGQKYSELAEDQNLTVAMLIRLATKFDFENRPRRVLECYKKAVPYLGQTTPLLRGRVYAGLAGKYAQCGEKQDALNFLDLAHATFPSHPEDDPAFHYVYIDRYQLLLWNGITRKHLGQHNLAWDTFVQVGETKPRQGLLERMRIEFLNYSAEAAIGLRDLEKCATYLEVGGKDTLAFGNEQRYAEICDTYHVAKTLWPHESKVLALQELFSQR